MKIKAFLSSIPNTPELNVALFAFLLNFVWEFWQVPFFQAISDAPHWEAVKFCTLATLGDVGIALVAFWTVAAIGNSRSWIRKPSTREVLIFVAVGVLITLAAEWLATEVLDRWAYATSMPTLPLLGTGLLPLLQWILLPPLVVWFARRQLT